MDSVHLDTSHHSSEGGVPLGKPEANKGLVSRIVEILFTPFKRLTDRIFQSNPTKAKPLTEYKIRKGKELYENYGKYREYFQEIVDCLKDNPDKDYCEGNLPRLQAVKGLRKFMEGDLNKLTIRTRLRKNNLKNKDIRSTFESYANIAQLVENCRPSCCGINDHGIATEYEFSARKNDKISVRRRRKNKKVGFLDPLFSREVRIIQPFPAVPVNIFPPIRELPDSN